MKEMALRDILLRKDEPLTSVSIYRDGRWQFTFPTNLVRTAYQRAFYLMSEVFGLVKRGNISPKTLARKGAPGDYVVLNPDGTYAIVTPGEFGRIFPTPNLNPPEVLKTSDQLKDPDFLTNILKGS